MKYYQYFALCSCLLVFGQAFSLPQHVEFSEHYQQKAVDSRKFAEKPNSLKKVGLDDIEEISTNQIQEGGNTGFSWSNMLSMLMQMLLGQTTGITGPSKNEIDEVPPSPWANLLSVGLRVLTAILGGPQQTVDGIDKVDNQSSPMQQFISIVLNLLDALKTSFSHRSLTARSIGKRDTVSEAAVASISMLKGYVKSIKSFGNLAAVEEEGQRGCAERALCEASAECIANAQGTSSIFCQLGSYATSYLLQKQSGVGFDALYAAGRRGRSGEDCRSLFVECNAV